MNKADVLALLEANRNEKGIQAWTRTGAPDDDFFPERIEHIRQTFSGEERAVNHAMGVALMGMGMRNPNLHAAALQVDKEMGSLSIG